MKPTILITIMGLVLFSAGYWAAWRAATSSEYERVVLAVAEAYEIDPSKVEQDARLVPVDRTTNAVLRKVAECTLTDAQAGKCWLPCASDEDCLAKNGMADH